MNILNMNGQLCPNAVLVVFFNIKILLINFDDDYRRNKGRPLTLLRQCLI